MKRRIEIKSDNSVSTIYIDGKPSAPMSMTLWTRTEDNKDIFFHEDYLDGLKRGGIKTFFIACNAEWCEPGGYNVFRKEAMGLLSKIPDANIILRIGLHPSNEWIQQNPDECFTVNGGSKPSTVLATGCYNTQLPHQYSLASAKWREKAGEYLNLFMDKVEKEEFAERIIGIFFVAGHTAEWYHNIYADKEDWYGEFSGAFKRSFTKFLKEKYKTQESLRKHWKNETATFENPQIPPGKLRYFAKNMDNEIAQDGRITDLVNHDKYLKGANIGHFLDVDNYQCVQDFFLAFDNSIADSQLYFAKMIKDRYNGNMLTGAFFGYYGWTDFFDSGVTVGVIKLLESGYMDFLSAPGEYRNRQLGNFTGQRVTTDAFAIRNKIIYLEEDTRTHLEKPFFKKLFDYYTIEDSLNILKRDFGRNICENTYAWWFDQHNEANYGLDGGRYRHEQIYSLFARQQELADNYYKKNREKGNEIAFIYDEESVKVISNASTKALVTYFRDYELARIGGGVDQYYHNELAFDNMPDYKLYVFFNALVLSEKERADIKTKLSKNNAVAIWVYAPGIINPDAYQKFDVKHMRELSGIDFEMKLGIYNPKYRFLKTNNIITDAMDKHELFGYESSPFRNNISMGTGQALNFNFPLFVPKAENMDILANYAESGYPAVVYKKNDGFRSIYHGAKILDHRFVREAAKFAGCHIISDDSNVIYSCRSFITVHASKTGKVKLKFDKEVDLYEVYENKYYAKRIKEADISMYLGETKMFSLIGAL